MAAQTLEGDLLIDDLVHIEIGDRTFARGDLHDAPLAQQRQMIIDHFRTGAADLQDDVQHPAASQACDLRRQVLFVHHHHMVRA